ncbi:toxin-antitoxin system TumE family protein [Azotobacter beijerinckii]|uniref:toxin-antitoxin system TumE family protein n=1 Tax=Azotobacter beijerinckii TaxID=170623 RepID=UPI001C3152AB|nr:DUF6516 family protein [Azotobacter beijerinckii]
MILKRRDVLDEHRFTEAVIWELTQPLPGSAHRYKYRLAYVVDGVCMVRYDNESGKGDHKHLGADEQAVAFTGIADLLRAFRRDIENWRP